MLRNRFLIDNIDTYTEYGLFIKDGGLAALLAWPQFKNVKIYNWAEEDGIIADLRNMRLDGRNVSVQFHMEHSDAPSMARKLERMLTSVTYHAIRCLTLGKTYTMRYVSNGSFSMNDDFDTLAITFAEDMVSKPVIGHTATLDFGDHTETFTIAVPESSSTPASGYLLDGIEMSMFGMYVTHSTFDTFQKMPSAKEKMKRGVSIQSGYIYDGTGAEKVSYADVTLNIHVRTSSVTEFWQRWYAMFAILFANGSHTIEGGGRRCECYYKSMKPTRFYPLSDGGVWCDFSVTLAVTKMLPLQVIGTSINGDMVAILIGNNTIITI